MNCGKDGDMFYMSRNGTLGDEGAKEIKTRSMYY
jgi:hypothetical protein